MKGNRFRIGEFFSDSGGQRSMSRLLLFMSFFPASAMLIRINDADALMWYLGAYAGLAANNKWAEKKNGLASGKLADDTAGADGSGRNDTDK